MNKLDILFDPSLERRLVAFVTAKVESTASRANGSGQTLKGWVEVVPRSADFADKSKTVASPKVHGMESTRTSAPQR
jgi:hypothetical protein